MLLYHSGILLEVEVEVLLDSSCVFFATLVVLTLARVGLMQLVSRSDLISVVEEVVPYWRCEDVDVQLDISDAGGSREDWNVSGLSGSSVQSQSEFMLSVMVDMGWSRPAWSGPQAAVRTVFTLLEVSET